MYPFEYHRARTVEDALQYGRDAQERRFLAGGMSLIPTMKLRLSSPTTLVDLGDLTEIAGVSVQGASVVIGAMTRHVTVARSELLRKHVPALNVLAEGIGDVQVRHRGTIGGSLANNDPAADYPSAVLGLAATVHTNRRSIHADQFFMGLFKTALEEDEMITKVEFPIPEKACYIKFANLASRFAIVGVFLAKTGSSVRLAVTGAGPGVFRARAMEDALANDFSPEALSGIHVSPSKLMSDVHGSAAYRSRLLTELAKRAVKKLSDSVGT